MKRVFANVLAHTAMFTDKSTNTGALASALTNTGNVSPIKNIVANYATPASVKIVNRVYADRQASYDKLVKEIGLYSDHALAKLSEPCPSCDGRGHESTFISEALTFPVATAWTSQKSSRQSDACVDLSIEYKGNTTTVNVPVKWIKLLQVDGTKPLYTAALFFDSNKILRTGANPRLFKHNVVLSREAIEKLLTVIGSFHFVSHSADLQDLVEKYKSVRVNE
jgi:hypothetical protein